MESLKRDDKCSENPTEGVVCRFQKIFVDPITLSVISAGINRNVWVGRWMSWMYWGKQENRFLVFIVLTPLPRLRLFPCEDWLIEVRSDTLILKVALQVVLDRGDER